MHVFIHFWSININKMTYLKHFRAMEKCRLFKVTPSSAATLLDVDKHKRKTEKGISI